MFGNELHVLAREDCGVLHLKTTKGAGSGDRHQA